MTVLSEIEIRAARLKDTLGIAEILRELGWFEHINDESPKDTELRLERQFRLCEADDSHELLVAEDRAGDVVGYVSVHWLPYMTLPGTEGYVSEIYIRESARGKGVGKKLLQAVRRSAEHRGCTRLMLLNSRGHASYQRGFYEKDGWGELPEVATFVLPIV
jgi:GNAT superfamily N-acetyltransferase